MARIAGRSLLALAMAALLYFAAYRPTQLRWGATPDELRRTMPGDEIQPKPIFNATRAITVEAPPQQVWPWIVQMGYRRAGWYGYDWIDNDGIPSADRVLPEWQHLQAGDTLPIWRNLDFRITVLEPNRYLVFAGRNLRDSMAVGLYPADGGQTRLVWRIRLGPYNWKSPVVALQAFTDLTDFIAVRQNLLGIKARAEGRALESQTRKHGELGLWFAAFLVFVAAEVALIARRELWMPLIIAAGTGMTTIWLVLAKPAMWIDVVALVAGTLLVRLACRVELARKRHQ